MTPSAQGPRTAAGRALERELARTWGSSGPFITAGLVAIEAEAAQQGAAGERERIRAALNEGVFSSAYHSRANVLAILAASPDVPEATPNECPHGYGLTCRLCDREVMAEEATWD